MNLTENLKKNMGSLRMTEEFFRELVRPIRKRAREFGHICIYFDDMAGPSTPCHLSIQSRDFGFSIVVGLLSGGCSLRLMKHGRTPNGRPIRMERDFLLANPDCIDSIVEEIDASYGDFVDKYPPLW